MNVQGIAHCRGLYLREFAYKTTQGIDEPNKNGILPELRRERYRPITNDKWLSFYMDQYANRGGEYITVYSFEKVTEKGAIDYSTAKINRIYLDFDCESEPQKAISEAIMTIRLLVKNGIYPHCYFSGKKGIAMYIEFKTIEIKPENKKDVLTMFVDTLEDSLRTEYENFFGLWIPTIQPGFGAEYETLDKSIGVDLARVSRIPNSKHRSGLYCIPLTYGDLYRGIGHIRELAKRPRMVDLDDIIVVNIMRNGKIPFLLKALEHEAEANREYESNVKKLQQHKYAIMKLKRPERRGRITDTDIQRARDIPLSQLISSEDRVKCPIHHGGNPTAFYIDHVKNLWHCFACGKGGSSIDYIMESRGVDFKTAVIELIGSVESQ